MVNRNWVVAALLIVTSITAHADDPVQRSTLKGLGAVRVLIAPLDASLSEEGLTEPALRAIVETRIRDAGIRPLAQNEKAPGLPVLEVVVRGYRNPQIGIYSFSVGVQLDQLAKLERNPSITAMVTTWTSDTATGLLGKAMVGTLQMRVAEATDQFVKAYQGANSQ